MILRGIFGRFADTPAAPKPNGTPESSQSAANRGSVQPIPHFDGAMFPSWPEQRFPLPLPTPAEQATDMVYILQAPEVRGKFDVGRAAALNVPKGPIRGQLTKGATITFDDPTAEGGVRTVRPEDCLTGGGPGKVSNSRF
jgi:ribonuclease Z